MENETKSTKKIGGVHKCATFHCLDSRQRNDFCVFLAAREGSYRTMGDRILYRGFKSWERLGIRNIMRNIVPNCKYSPSEFYASLNDDERLRLTALLRHHGMCVNTVKSRFLSGNFRQWEIEGIDNLFAQWQREQARKSKAK